ncbi:MAG: PilZ domain-containing protein [Armatimonadetes bacterium]|nr:PilZ domain-containing protein [Armatimonadota bacterium]
MSFNTGSDGRRFERFDILDYAMLSSKNHKEPFRTVIVDIGLGGLQLKSKDQLPVGEVCSIQIAREEADPLCTTGEVRYSRQAEDKGLYSSGFKFLPSNHVERAAIAEYVHSVFMRNEEADIDWHGVREAKEAF